jgi:hypothetical protein
VEAVEREWVGNVVMQVGLAEKWWKEGKRGSEGFAGRIGKEIDAQLYGIHY